MRKIQEKRLDDQGTMKQWPIKHTCTKRLVDARYSVTIEGTGQRHKRKQPRLKQGQSYVFRFCDDFISAHNSYIDAVCAAKKYQQERNV